MAALFSNAIRKTNIHVWLCGFVLAATITAKPPDPALGQGWMPEFDLAARQVVALAEAIPAEKFSWRPSEGVRSVSEVFMHIAVSDLYFMNLVGAPVDMSQIPKDYAKRFTSKAQVLEWLNRSFTTVRANYAKIDSSKQVTLLNKPTTAGNVMLRLLVHTNEHMGQSVAYARMNGVKPPWSD